MIKAEVVFNEDKIIIDGKEVVMDWYYECLKTPDGKSFYNIEEAIKHCLENK